MKPVLLHGRLAPRPGGQRRKGRGRVCALNKNMLASVERKLSSMGPIEILLADTQRRKSLPKVIIATPPPLFPL